METPRLNFAVQHWLARKEALMGCFVCMSFSRSLVQVFCDRVALALGHPGHALPFR
jgi:hypothetical protein